MLFNCTLHREKPTPYVLHDKLLNLNKIEQNDSETILNVFLWYY